MLITQAKYGVYHIFSTYQISKESLWYFFCNVIFYITVLSTAHLVTWRQMWRLVITFVATFTWNARRMLTVKKSRQMLRAHRKRTERRRKVKNEKGERIGGQLEGSILHCKMRQDKAKFFLFSYWKGKKVVARKRGGEKDGRGKGKGGECLTFFQRYYKLSECSCFYSFMYVPDVIFMEAHYNAVQVLRIILY